MSEMSGKEKPRTSNALGYISAAFSCLLVSFLFFTLKDCNQLSEQTSQKNDSQLQ